MNEEINFKYLDLRIGHFSCPLFWVTGTAVYSHEILFEFLRNPVKTCLKVTGTQREFVWKFGSRNCFKSDLLRPWIIYIYCTYISYVYPHVLSVYVSDTAPTNKICLWALYLLPHVRRWISRRTPFRSTRWSWHWSTRKPCWLQWTRERKSTCMPFCRDRPAKALRPKSRGPGGQDARRWSQSQENLIWEICLDCEFHSTDILEIVQIQLFCTSLELKTKQGQGANLSIMIALKMTNPGAKSLFDLGVCCKPRSDTTRSMITVFDSMMGCTIFDASQASSDDFETSEQNPSGNECYLRSFRDPGDYSKGAPDPKHHVSTMKAEWIKSHTSEMDGLWYHGVFQKVLRSSLTPQDRVFTGRFFYKIKPKKGGFWVDKCKVRLVVQGQHIRRKGEDSVRGLQQPFQPRTSCQRILLHSQFGYTTKHVHWSRWYFSGFRPSK